MIGTDTLTGKELGGGDTKRNVKDSVFLTRVISGQQVLSVWTDFLSRKVPTYLLQSKGSEIRSYNQLVELYVKFSFLAGCIISIILCYVLVCSVELTCREPVCCGLACNAKRQHVCSTMWPS